MKPLVTQSLDQAIPLIQAGKIGVIPSDTVYGIVASAFDAVSVERLYSVKNRNQSKPGIILIAEIDDLSRFNIAVDEPLQKELHRFWPGPVSVILEVDATQFTHLHRGQGSIGFRLPASEKLRQFLAQTGPLVSSSANLEGHPTATNIQEAYTYFGDSVDFYIDGGQLTATPSTLIRIKQGQVEILRQGQANIHTSTP